jgi:outer membrane protein TolC
MNPMTTKVQKLATVVTVAALLSACAVTTPQFTDEQRLARVTADLESLFVEQEAVTRPITLAEAMARAIKYNMDHRVKLMEYAVANRNVEVARMDLLPDLVLSAGYTDRSNEPGATSISLLTGEISLEPSTSQERQRELADAVFYWNLLDFGVSYVTAKQRYDEAYIAEERRRKVVQNIIHDVVEAYWRAWNAQNLMGRMERLIEETDEVIEESKKLVDTGSQPKEEALRYQRTLMEIRTQLWEMRERMALSQTRLSTLINLRPGTQFSLDAPRIDEAPPLFNKTLEDLEQEALMNRPELREEDYRLRISRGDVKKAMLRMFPGIEITAGGHYDSNIYLFNQSWADGLVQVSWNLFNALRGMQGKKFRESQVELADTRRMALSMAVMTQVRLAAQRYDLARARYQSLTELSDVNEALRELVQDSPDTTTRFERIQARAVSAASTMRSNLAFAEVQAAMSRLLNSIGVDPLPEEVTSHELVPLTEAIESHWNKTVAQRFAIQITLPVSDETAHSQREIETRRHGYHPKGQSVSTTSNETIAPEVVTDTRNGDPQGGDLPAPGFASKGSI